MILESVQNVRPYTSLHFSEFNRRPEKALSALSTDSSTDAARVCKLETGTPSEVGLVRT